LTRTKAARRELETKLLPTPPHKHVPSSHRRGAGYPVTGRFGWVGDNPGLPRVGLAVDVIGTADKALY